MSQQYGAARHTFYYLLVLVTLSFTAIGVGQILFQIINSLFPETTFLYDTVFDQEILRFGMSSVIVAGPIYWFVTRAINKELAEHHLDQQSRVRKWLTYLILFASAVIVIGFLMGILNNFLNGELTVKFILKAITAIGIAGLVFGYYLHDIRRDKFGSDKAVVMYRNIFLVLTIGSLIASFFFVDSPFKARAIREDDERVNRLQNISWQVENYYRENNTLPTGLEDIEDRLTRNALIDPVSGERLEYRSLGGNSYELCADFELSNRESDQPNVRYKFDGDWLHDAGRKCFEKKVNVDEKGQPLRVPEFQEVPLPPVS